MNRQDFDKWKEEELLKKYPFTNDRGGAFDSVSQYMKREACKIGADAAYNLLSDPDYSQEQEIKELHSIVENLKRENTELRKRCEAAEAVLNTEPTFHYLKQRQLYATWQQFKKDNNL